MISHCSPSRKPLVMLVRALGKQCSYQICHSFWLELIWLMFFVLLFREETFSRVASSPAAPLIFFFCMFNFQVGSSERCRSCQKNDQIHRAKHHWRVQGFSAPSCQDLRSNDQHQSKIWQLRVGGILLSYKLPPHGREVGAT